MEGQLMPQERAALHEMVRHFRPQVVFETGTWKGGGSTYQIACALRENTIQRGIQGHLHTCDVDPEMFQEAQKIYLNDGWPQWVTCYLRSSMDMIEQFKREGTKLDFVFFDSVNDADEALSDFQAIDPILKPGTIFSMHDWDFGSTAGGGVSEKAAKLRPYLENVPHWKIISQLTAPISVGLVFAMKIQPA